MNTYRVAQIEPDSMLRDIIHEQTVLPFSYPGRYYVEVDAPTTIAAVSAVHNEYPVPTTEAKYYAAIEANRAVLQSEDREVWLAADTSFFRIGGLTEILDR